MSVDCKVLFVYGSDDFLVDRRARALYNSHCAGGEIFTCEAKFDIRQFIGKLCESLNTVPMFAPTNDIWIRSVNFFSGAESEEVKNGINFLLDTIRHIEGVVLISASPVDRRTKLFKELAQLAECHDITDMGDKNSGEFIRNVCAENGVKIEDEGADLLQNLTGNDARSMQLELEKLASYIYRDRDVITVEDVNLLVDPSNGGEFFQQIENFYSPNVGEKLDAIGRYFYFVSEARPLIAGLQNRTRLMIQLRALVDSNKIQPGRSISKSQLDSLAKLLNATASEKNSCNIFSQNPWYLSKLLDSVSRYSLNHLLDIQLALMDAIGETAGGCGDQAAVIKKLALKF